MVNRLLKSKKINKFVRRATLINHISGLLLASIFIAAISGFFILSSCSALDDRPAGNNSSHKTGLVLPDYSGYVNDYTGTLSPEWLKKTEELVQKVKSDTGCEIAVAVIESLEGLTVEEYALKLFEKWGVGEKELDNGILLLVSMSERQLRIEVGYGLESIITDLTAKTIIDNAIVPRFKIDDYNTGIYNGITAIANIIYKELGSSNLTVETAAAEIKKPFTETVWFPILIIFAILAPWLIIGAVGLSIFLKIYIREHKCPQCKRLGLVIKRKWLIYPAYDYPGRQEVLKYCRFCSYRDLRTVSVARLSRTYGSGSSISNSSGSFSSHSSSSHSSSSSFSGGSSGGGGSSGRW